MNFPLFIAKRIFSDKGDRHQVSRPAIRIATIGVAIGLAVMIITISVVLGFKHTVRDKVVGFGSHLQVYNIQGSVYPLCINDSTLAAYEQAEGVSHAERFTTSQGILKTDNDFLGVMLKGIGPEYDTHFINDCIVEGELPAFTDSTSNYPLVISKTMAQKLRLHAGDRVFAYFIGEKDVRARRFNVSAIYQTNMKRFDDLICLTDISVTQRLNGWDKEQCTGAELLVNDFDRLKPINSNVTSILRDNTDRDGNMSVSYPITDIYPQVFSWLELLDINVWIILGLMIAVAGNEEKRNWTLENCWYNIPLEKMADSPIMQAKYLLLHVKGETEVGNIRKIVKSRHDVWSKEKLTNEGYPKPGNPFYYMLRIRKEDGTDESIRYKVFDLKNTPAIVWGTPQMPFYFVRLKDLNAKE